MSIVVEFGTPATIDADPAWMVVADHLPTEGNSGQILLWGFARKIDAEIAVKALGTTGIDFTAERAELKPQWEKFGGRDAVMRHVCERLQW